MIRQFEIASGDLNKVTGAVRDTRGNLPADVGVRVVINSAALSRAEAFAALDLIAKQLAQHNWPMD